VYQTDIDVDPRLNGRLLNCIDHRRRHAGQLLLVMPAALTFDHAVVGHDVGGNAAVDEADVGAGLFIEAAEPHRAYRPSGGLDRAAAALGLHAGMSGPAVERSPEGLHAGSLDYDAADRFRTNPTRPPGGC